MAWIPAGVYPVDSRLRGNDRWIPAPAYSGMISKVQGRSRGLSPPRKRGSTSFLYARWRLCTVPAFIDEITGQDTTRPPNAATGADLRSTAYAEDKF